MFFQIQFQISAAETFKPFFHVSDAEEDGCLDLFPRGTEDMAISAKVGSSTEVDLKLGLWF